MGGLKKKYVKGDLTVVWQPDLCIHSKKCFKGLPNVFNPANRPWVNLDDASNKTIRKQVDNCPSGALSYEKHETESGTIENNDIMTVDVSNNGPILIKGPVAVSYNGKQEIREMKTTAFCRCGASGNKPFCDGSHKRVGFIG